ncbi:uncharacterized protein LOC125318183 [Corvus hawaiiensis]|uniref:uncharacterized protein LOC125318183 n=1 Tax=Corvus hawaiiensis TaxID=134902 RepID=UPI00201864F3|nr:uncharacterized protein LOC125318183 [Corvus hawaiiensis]
MELQAPFSRFPKFLFPGTHSGLSHPNRTPGGGGLQTLEIHRECRFQAPFSHLPEPGMPLQAPFPLFPARIPAGREHREQLSPFPGPHPARPSRGLPRSQWNPEFPVFHIYEEKTRPMRLPGSGRVDKLEFWGRRIPLGGSGAALLPREFRDCSRIPIPNPERTSGASRKVFSVLPPWMDEPSGFQILGFPEPRPAAGETLEPGKWSRDLGPSGSTSEGSGATS